MNANDLKTRLSEVLNETTSINLFFVLKTDEDLVVKKADLDGGDTTTELNQMFRQRIQMMIDNDELSVISLSTADERMNALYEYDYDSYPDTMSFITNFDIHNITAIQNFNFSTDSFKDLMGYLIYIGDMNQGILCFKKHYPFSLIKRDSFLIYKRQERLTKLENEDILRLNNDIHLFMLDGTMFVCDVKTIESYLGFEDLVRHKATEAIESIRDIGLLKNVDILSEAAEDMSFSRKLSKLAGQSLIITNGIPNHKVINFSKTHPGLRDIFKYTDDDSQIILDSKKSQKAFLKLLNDDFLISELTEQPYDSLAKDKITV